jgi:hypothetical protein
VCAEDWKSNFEALRAQLRILSAYPIDAIRANHTKLANAILGIFNINRRKSTWSFYKAKTTCSAAGFAVVDRRGNVTRIDQRTTGDLWEEIAPSPPSPVSAQSVGVAIMLKEIIVASALALFSSGPAGAGGADTPRTTPGFFRRRPSLRGANAAHGGVE